MGLQMDFKASDNVPDTATNELETGVIAGDEKAVTMKTTDTGSDALIAAKAGEALASAMATAMKDAGKTDSKKVNDRRFNIVTDPSRDARLTDFGKDTLTDRYLLPGEVYQDLFARVADAYADDEAHAPESVPTLVLERWLGWTRAEQL